MSFIDQNSNGMVMPVGPMYGANGNGFGNFGDGSFWIIVLFLFALMGNGFGNAFGGNGGAMPFIMNNTQNDVQRGFDQQAIISGINGINSNITSLAQGQCTGFAGVNANVFSGFATAESAAANRQMSNLQQQYAMQTAIDNRLDSMAMTQQQCCCDNKAAVADLKYTMAQEGAVTRANTDAKVQTVMDKLCQLEMDGMRQNYENRIASLEAQLNEANRQASQANQTAAILSNLNPTPVPAYPANGCGCGNRFGVNI